MVDRTLPSPLQSRRECVSAEVEEVWQVSELGIWVRKFQAENLGSQFAVVAWTLGMHENQIPSGRVPHLGGSRLSKVT